MTATDEHRHSTLFEVIEARIAKVEATASDEVDPVTAAYKDPQYEEVTRLESLMQALELLLESEIGADDLQMVLAMRKAAPHNATLIRIERALRACLFLMPELRPSSVLAMDLDESSTQILDTWMEQGRIGSYSEGVALALEAARADHTDTADPGADEPAAKAEGGEP